MKGVHYNNQCRKWMARAIDGKTRVYLGIFETEEQAIAAVNEFRVGHPVPEKADRSKKVTVEILKNRLHYDPDTGWFTWKNDSGEFKDGSGAGRNQVKTGQTAGSIQRGKVTMYVAIHINSMMLKAHRLAWLYQYGRWPKGQIDHINGDGLDNRICNLREVTNSQNQRNRRLGKNNKSGVIGVLFHITHGKWVAFFSRRTLGWFKTKEEAVACRKKFEQENGFSPTHGRIQ